MIFDAMFRALDVMLDFLFQMVKLPPIPPELATAFNAVIAYASEGFKLIALLLGFQFTVTVLSFVVVMVSFPYATAIFNFVVRKIPMLNIR